MGSFSALRREHKEAIGLLYIGTFLEYFDLMLYVHMAVLLNDLFFPKTDPYTASLLAAFAFCSTYVFRPFGALLFGYIGDHIGRKSTLIITTFMMALSCLIMALLPTYTEIGILASIMMIGCRVLQSISATGEVIGAEIYLTEVLKPPLSYKIVSLLAEMCTIGGMAALFLAAVVLKFDASWRWIFMFGCLIAFIGSGARTRLSETIEFVDMKKRMKKTIEESDENGVETAAELLKKDSPIWQEKVKFGTGLAYFFIYSGFPLCFYLTFIYGADVLKNNFHYSADQIVVHNLWLTVLGFFSGISFIILSTYFKALSLIKVRAIVFLFLSMFMSIFMPHTTSFMLLCVMQIASVVFCLGTVPGIPIFFQHFPVFKRFTYSSLIYSFTRAIMYLVTSLGLVCLVNSFGRAGIMTLTIPVSLCFLWGVRHFEKLENFKYVGEKIPTCGGGTLHA